MAEPVRDAPYGASLVDASERAAAPARSRAAPLSRSAWSWAGFEGGRDAYVMLVTIYVFTPYFATVMVGDPVRGQAMVAQLSMAYGLVAAVTCPFLGVTVDRMGPRKPWLLACSGLMSLLMAALWWARPDGSGLSAPATAWVLGLTGVLFAYNEVLHNAMLPHAATPGEASRASGLGLALGNAFAVALLVAVLWAFALPGRIALPGLPHAPLFGLSRAAHETDRITGPICAVAIGLGSIPLLLFARDAPRVAADRGASRRRGGWAGDLVALLKSLGRERRMALFLGSRMLYTDGMNAIIFFSGVYAAGVMGWKALDLLAYGVVLSVFAALGGVLAAWLDGAFGPKRAVQVQIVATLAGELAVLGIAPGRILYLPASTAPVWGAPLLRTLPDLAFMGVGCLIAMGVSGQFASSRVLLTRLTTPDRVAGWFGLYALSGTVTLWLGALLVSVATGLLHTQQAGFYPILAMLVLGFAGLSLVKAPSSGEGAAVSSLGR